MVARRHDLWSLVHDQPFVDPEGLFLAMEDQIRQGDLDYRSRLLIRDGLSALEDHWGQEKLQAALTASSVANELQAIRRESFERPGFQFLRDQLTEPTKPETIRELLRAVGVELDKPVRAAMAGSGSMILQGFLARGTSDLDFVDEVPAPIRALGPKLQQLEQRYRLILGHVQQHYLPTGWDKRLHSQPAFGRLQVDLVDARDVFLGKLFSIREKDIQDLRVLATKLDKAELSSMLKETCGSVLCVPDLRGVAEKNWYVLYGEPLPA